MKKLIFLFALVAISHSIVFSQGCLPEGITFTTQEQIDNFQVNYPGCTEIDGIVFIMGFEITNLYGLSVLTSIGQSLRIQFTENLENLEGLHNLTSIGIDLEIRNNNVLTSTAGLEGLTNIPEDLWIESNPVLNDLSGLSNISSIGLALIIDHNPLLLEMDDFNNLTSVEELFIYWNDQITNLNGLINVNSTINSVNISDNQNLSDISGLQNFQPEDDLGLHIMGNPLLAQCDIQSICEYLSAPNGTIEIHDNAPGCNSLEEVQEACEYSGCLPDGITFTTQEQIDNFQTNYPGCIDIEGDVEISGNNITNLEGLSVLQSIGGNLEITDNTNLETLTGLDSLEYIGGDFWIINNPLLINLEGFNSLTNIGSSVFIGANDGLLSFSGLNNLISIGEFFSIGENLELKNLNGLENLSSVGGEFIIGENPTLGNISGLGALSFVGVSLVFYHNYTLVNFDGLNELTTIGAHLIIDGNQALQNISDLSNISSIGGSLEILSNNSLTNLFGIDSINPNSIDDLTIKNNPALSECDVYSICQYLSTPNGTIEIHDNAPGCNTPEEVQLACETAIEENITVEISLFPNPASSFITITTPEDLPIEEVIIYNHLGQKVLETKPVNNVLDVSKLKPGIYFIEVVTKDWSERTKFVKQ